MDKYNVASGTKKIIDILTKCDLYESFRQNDSIFIGGSLPSFCLKTTKTDDFPNDIDVYTTNYVKTMNTFTTLTSWKFNRAKSAVITFCPCNYTTKYSVSTIQFISSEIQNMNDDVLSFYDCGIICVAFHPASNQFIIHQRFFDEINNGCFTLYGNRSVQEIHSYTIAERVIKLHTRSKNWYNCKLKITDYKIEFHEYYKQDEVETKTVPFKLYPPYIQLFHHKYNCISCNKIDDNLFCTKCFNEFNQKIFHEIEQTPYFKNKQIFIFGGSNGFGKILSDYFTDYHQATVFKTSRTDGNAIKFDLDDPKRYLTAPTIKKLLSSDVIVLNAYSTLEKNQMIWNNDVDNFDKELALNRITTNFFGYVDLLKIIMDERKKQIQNTHKSNPITLIFMDANESKYEGNIADGKHCELNACKSACKNFIYTNSRLLSAMNINVICFDIGWLSYHGIPIECIEAKSKNLIPPRVATKCMAYAIANRKDMPIYDCSTYDVVRELKTISIIPVQPISPMKQRMNGGSIIERNAVPFHLLKSELIQNAFCANDGDDCIPVPFSEEELKLLSNKKIDTLDEFATIFEICDYFMVSCPSFIFHFIYNNNYRYEEKIKQTCKTKAMCATSHEISLFYNLLNGTLDKKELNRKPFLEFLMEPSDYEKIQTIVTPYSCFETFLNDENLILIKDNEIMQEITNNFLLIDKPNIILEQDNARKLMKPNNLLMCDVSKIRIKKPQDEYIHYKCYEQIPNANQFILFFDENVTIDDLVKLNELNAFSRISEGYVHFFDSHIDHHIIIRKPFSYNLECFKFIVGKLFLVYEGINEILHFTVKTQSSENLNYLLEFL